jgi:hypothetical protein
MSHDWMTLIIGALIAIAKVEDIFYRRRNGAERIRRIVREELQTVFKVKFK